MLSLDPKPNKTQHIGFGHDLTFLLLVPDLVSSFTRQRNGIFSLSRFLNQVLLKHGSKPRSRGHSLNRSVLMEALGKENISFLNCLAQIRRTSLVTFQR